MQRKPVPQANAEGIVLTKAAVNAADRLGLTARLLSAAARPTNPAYFGRLAPYFERDCLRSFTPCVSRTPRST